MKIDLVRHYSRLSASWPAAPLAAQSLARRKSRNAGPNRRSRARAQVAWWGWSSRSHSVKGGAGKTTLATQFAVTWARRGARVATLDIDPQGSFSAWVDLRRARLGAKGIGFDFAALPGWRAAQWVDDRVGSVDLVVIDAPPHAETEARIAVRAARLVVIPVQPSPLDLWATAETLKMAQDERRRSLVVLNRVPPRSRLTEDIAADLAGAGTPIAATRIGNRVALAQAMALGLGVIENPRMTPAAAEISALAEEIRGAL